MAADRIPDEVLDELISGRRVSVVRGPHQTAELPEKASPGDAVFALQVVAGVRSLAGMHVLAPSTTTLTWRSVYFEQPITLSMLEARPYWQDVFVGARHVIAAEPARELWRVVIEANPTVVDVLREFPVQSPALANLLEDPRWKLRPREINAIIRAVAVAAAESRAVDDVLLFAAVLAEARPSAKYDTATFTIKTLAAQAGREVTEPRHALVSDLLGLNTIEAEAGRDEVIANASPTDAALILGVIQEAETIRAATSADNTIHTRHVIAALLARPHRSAVAPYLDERNFDVPSLRRALLDFIVEEHGENADAWREVLFVSSQFDMANRLASDVWTYDDALGYRVYARAIADAILRGATSPPLTISIQAPWGQGKTSLMKMIQEYLDPDSRTRNDAPPEMFQLSGAVQSTYRDFLRWLGAPDLLERIKARFTKKPTDAPPPSADVGLIQNKPGTIPTVWFNPLYYRERKQIWAGLAHAILHQLAQQLPSQRIREEFWLRLQFARVNVAAVRRDVHKFLFFRVVPVAGFWLVAAIVLAVVAALGPAWLWLGSGTAVAGGLLHVWKKLEGVLEKQTLDANFERYVAEPNYAGELGLLHLVDHDLDLALRLLVGKRNIAVFVDDLDRCDPGTVNEIVLAINHFLSVQNRKAFFFLGMDMAMVAEALESVHKGKAGFGWRFMEKFVQLPFVIPHLDPAKAKAFAMDQLRGPKPLKEGRWVEHTNKIQAIAERVKSAGTPSEVGHIARVVLSEPMPPAERAVLEEAFSSRTSELMSDPDSEEIQRIAELAVAGLELNPRTIKRYFCLVRVLRNVQIATGVARSAESDRMAILRTAHLLMNWPEFAQWLRENPSRLADIDAASRKSKNHAAYRKALAKVFGDVVPACVASETLYEFLHKAAANPPALTDLYAARLV